MDLRQLNYVVVLAEKQNLSKAAEELYLTPSALSQYISKLEGEIGTQIFKRVKGKWPLTDAGSIYLQAAKDILMRQSRMNRDIGDIISCRTGVISTGITSGIASRMFATIFPKFNEAYPNVQIKLMEGLAREVENQAASGRLDLIFSTSGLHNPALTYESLMEERFVLAVSKAHPLAYLADYAPKDSLATVDLGLLWDQDFILAYPGMTIRTVTDRMFQGAGFAPKILFESASAQTLYNLADAGYGISIIPIGYMRENSSSVYFYTNPPGTWHRVAAYPKDGNLTSAERYFIELAREYFAKRSELPPSKPGIVASGQN